MTQQIIYQNSVYYMTYMMLRPDHQSNLIAYLYYMKYAKPGDFSFFCYINVNIEHCVYKNHDAMMIQRNVLLNDENKNNCTVILPGMH